MQWFEADRWADAAGSTDAEVSVSTSPEPAAPGVLQTELVERSRGRIPAPPAAPSAHASTIATLPGGDLLAYWWAGQRESGPDVEVYMSRFSGGDWSAPRSVVDRGTLAEQIGHGVRRIGNPVAWVAPDGRVHLYVVATGLGGWAASRVVQLTSDDEGRQFLAARVLPLSPLFNTSVLVRNAPVATTDGGWLLPAHFELGHKFGMVVSFDRDGTPRWKSRMGDSTSALQPAVVPAAGERLMAYLRSHGGSPQLQLASSVDHGRTWEELPASDVANHDNAAAVLRLTDGTYVMAHNVPMPGGSPRQWLRLSTSRDARQWQPAVEVRVGQANDEYSYPTLTQVGPRLHLTYTDRRKAIAHIVYDIERVVGALP